MNVSVDKVIVKKHLQLLMYDFALAMRNHVLADVRSSRMLQKKVLEFVWKLNDVELMIYSGT